MSEENCEMAQDTLRGIPQDLKNLRACLVCSLIKSLKQFVVDGCENCDEFLGMKGNMDNVYACTSSNFDGMTAVMNPEKETSWVCRWQRINRFCKKGVYAFSVTGYLPQSIVRDMKRNGIVYRPRDNTQN